MTEIAQLQHLAEKLGLPEFERYPTKIQLIRAIQQFRGGQPCFSTEKRNDCAEICEWRQDCRSHKAVWLR